MKGILYFPWATIRLDENTGRNEIQKKTQRPAEETHPAHDSPSRPAVAAITIPPQGTPTVPQPKQTTFAVTLNNNARLEANSLNIIVVFTQFSEGTEVFISAARPDLKWFIVPMINRVRAGGKLPLMVANNSDHPFILKAGKMENISIDDTRQGQEHVLFLPNPGSPLRPEKQTDILCDGVNSMTFSDEDDGADDDEDDRPFLPHLIEPEMTLEQRLALFDLSGPQPDDRIKLKTLIENYLDVFAFKDAPLGCTDLATHTIDTGNAAPVVTRPYRVPHALREKMIEILHEMLRQGVIEPANSPWSAPMILVAKKGPDGKITKYRPVIDWRGLNAVTVKRAYPLPLIQDVLDALQGCEIFSTADLDSGYWQVPMEESSKEKSAFSTPLGQFQCLRMGFGLVNGPSDFSALMGRIFSGGHEGVVHYMDDVVVGSKKIDRHLTALEWVFKKLRSAKLKLKPSKCHFLQKKVTLLGHIVSAEGTRPDPTKTETIAKYPIPKDKKALRSWIGMVNYYRRYIKGFSGIVKPLTDMTSDDAPYIWSEQCQEAFSKINEELKKQPLLRLPDFEKTFIVSTDASGHALGAVLEQEYEDGLHPVAFASRKLKKAEANYHTTERECLGIIFAIREFDIYLKGRPFILQTDHMCLKWLLTTSQVKGGKLARWVAELFEYEYTVRHVPGNKNAVADALSRVEINAVQQAITDQSAADATARALAHVWDREAIKEAQQLDGHCARVMRTLNDAPGGVDSPYFLDGTGILFYRDDLGPRLCVPAEMKERVLEICHDLPTGAHKGEFRMFHDIKLRFYWPGWHHDVREHCALCKSCVQKKGRSMPPQLFRPSAPVIWRAQRIAIDVKGPLPMSKKRNRYLITFLDMFTHWPEAAAVAHVDAMTVAQQLVDKIVSRYGVPFELLSDRGTNFTSSIIAAVAKILKMRQIFTAPYHPQGNGMLERTHQQYGNFIHQFCLNGNGDWEDNLPFILMAIRNSPNRTTGLTPHKMMFGTEMQIPWDDNVFPDKATFLPTKNPEEYAKQLHARIKIAQAAGLQLSEENREKYINRGKIPIFNEGDTVYRREMRPGKGKDGTKWRGPYKVLKRRSDVSYELELLNPSAREQKKCTVHISHLRTCGRLTTVTLGEPMPPRYVRERSAQPEAAGTPADEPGAATPLTETLAGAEPREPMASTNKQNSSAVDTEFPRGQIPVPSPVSAPLDEAAARRRRGRPRKGEEKRRAPRDSSAESPKGRIVGTHNLRPRQPQLADPHDRRGGYLSE
ncbi:Hypothetical predicted protein [Cloeon dipterum]|uniref:RNA-directed DNA polymerase n=1 Tax=Cloeon dipterum TaxID=197152 RepID=A0A8S1DIN1_9INSE|nr:Hypothetical predicted protein [Cloeon dipterum]